MPDAVWVGLSQQTDLPSQRVRLSTRRTIRAATPTTTLMTVLLFLAMMSPVSGAETVGGGDPLSWITIILGLVVALVVVTLIRRRRTGESYTVSADPTRINQRLKLMLESIAEEIAPIRVTAPAPTRPGSSVSAEQAATSIVPTPIVPAPIVPAPVASAPLGWAPAASARGVAALERQSPGITGRVEPPPPALPLAAPAPVMAPMPAPISAPMPDPLDEAEDAGLAPATPAWPEPSRVASMSVTSREDDPLERGEAAYASGLYDVAAAAFHQAADASESVNARLHALSRAADAEAAAGGLEAAVTTIDRLIDVGAAAVEHDPALREPMAAALLTSARHLAALGRVGDALASADELTDWLGETKDAALGAIAAAASADKVVWLGALGDERALTVYDDLVRAHGRPMSSGPSLAVAHLLLARAEGLAASGRHDAALTTFGEIDERFGAHPSPEMEDVLAAAACGGAQVFLDAGRPEEALAAMDHLAQMRREPPETLRVAVASGMAGRAERLADQGYVEAAIDTFDRTARRFRDDPAASARAEASRSLIGQIKLLLDAGRTEAALSRLDAWPASLAAQQGAAAGLVARHMLADAVREEHDGAIEAAERGYEAVVGRFEYQSDAAVREVVRQAIEGVARCQAHAAASRSGLAAGEAPDQPVMEMEPPYHDAAVPGHHAEPPGLQAERQDEEAWAPHDPAVEDPMADHAPEPLAAPEPASAGMPDEPALPPGHAGGEAVHPLPDTAQEPAHELDAVAPGPDEAEPAGHGEAGALASAAAGEEPSAPEAGAPADAMPQMATHEAASEEQAPHEAAPHEAAPHEAAPHEAAPHEAAPHEAAPHEAAAYEAAEYEAAPDEAAAPGVVGHEAAVPDTVEHEAVAPAIVAPGPPPFDQAWLDGGHNALRQGDAALAAQTFAAIIADPATQHAERASAHAGRAEALALLGREDDAFADLAALDGHAEYESAMAAVAHALNARAARMAEAGQTREALDAFERLLARMGPLSRDAGPAVTEARIEAMGGRVRCLGQLGEDGPAMDGYEALAALAQPPADLRFRMARMMVARADRFAAEDKSEEALAAFDAAEQRFAQDEDQAVVEQIALAKFGRGYALGRLGRAQEALAVYDDIVRQHAGSLLPALREQAAKALVNRGIRMAEIGEHEQALASFDEAIDRFGALHDPLLTDPLRRASLNRAEMLRQLGRPGEAATAIDVAVQRGADGEQLREQTAQLLYAEAIRQGEMGEIEGSIETYAYVIERFEEAREPGIAELVVRSLYNMAVRLGELDRNREAVDAYDRLLARLGDKPPPMLVTQGARALFNRAVRLGLLGEHEAAIASYDELLARHGGTASLQDPVARALVSKAMALGELGRFDEAIAVDEEAASRFAASTPLRELVLRARLHAAGMKERQGLGEEAAELYRAVVATIAGAGAPSLAPLGQFAAERLAALAPAAAAAPVDQAAAAAPVDQAAASRSSQAPAPAVAPAEPVAAAGAPRQPAGKRPPKGRKRR